MTATEIQEWVKHLLSEDVAATGSGLTTASSVESAVSMANDQVYAWAVDANPLLFSVRVDRTYSGAHSLTDLNPLRVNQVWVKQADTYYPVEQTVPTDPHVEIQDPTTQTVPTSYYVLADTLYLYPPPSESKSIRVAYVPRAATCTGSVEALSGKLPEHHELVAYQALLKFAAKDRDNSVSWLRMRNELRQELLRSTGKRHGKRAIRQIPYE